MASYKIKFKNSAEKELGKLPQQIVPQIISSIQKLAENPFPHGVKKLKGTEKSYRIRVGDYRILYTVAKKILTIEVIRIRHRKDVYRR